MRTLLLLLASSSLGAQTYTIAGVVQNPSGNPQKRVRVAMAPEADLERQTAMITAENGLFRFDGLPAGKYRLTAEPPVGGVQAFGQRTLATGFGTAVVTGPDQRTDNLVFRLIAPCAIRGRVVDTEGEPAERVLVQLFVSTIMRGKRTVFYAGSRYTDDRGVYRFGGVRDGSYYVVAAGQPWYANQAPAETALARTGFATVYYPGSPDPRGARMLSLKPGEEQVADFTVSAMPASVLTVTTKGFDGQARVNIIFEGIAGARTFAHVATANGGRPTQIRGIVPGRYSVRAIAQGKPLYGAANVEVRNGDASVEVSLVEAPKVTGKLWIEDAKAVPQGTFLELENETEGVHNRRAVEPDGSFHFDSIPPGKYRTFVALPGKNVHLRSVTVDGALAVEEMFEIMKDTRLELLGLLRGGRAAGVLVRDGKPVEGALALLAPKKESVNPLDYRAFQTDSDGTFEFDGLPAGEYVLIVREDWGDFEYGNPAAVRPYLESGRPLKVDGTSAVDRIRVELK
jgi:hypothetical protein